MSYQRVIPRDLFNEANLLKCLGRLWIETERFQPKHVKIEHDGEAFDIWQGENEGSISVSNIEITINGKRYSAHRPLNSRQPWPLYLTTEDDDGERIEVFQDDGELSTELLAIIQAPIAEAPEGMKYARTETLDGKPVRCYREQ